MGCALYSFGLQCFALPQGWTLGGAGGLATIWYRLWGVPIGLGVVLINIPLLIWGGKVLGGKALWRTAYATFWFSLVLGIGEKVFTYTYDGAPLTATVLGGVIMGAGLTFVYAGDYTTGGSDLAAQILAAQTPILSFGRWMLTLDGAVVLAGSLLSASVESGVYSVLTIFIYTQVFESYFQGRSRGKLALVITAHPEKLLAQISSVLRRGCTKVSARGGMGSHLEVLLCALSDRQLSLLRREIKALDPSAFVVVLRATEIWGEGFYKL